LSKALITISAAETIRPIPNPDVRLAAIETKYVDGTVDSYSRDDRLQTYADGLNRFAEHIVSYLA
jgi:hypothetical protein